MEIYINTRNTSCSCENCGGEERRLKMKIFFSLNVHLLRHENVGF